MVRFEVAKNRSLAKSELLDIEVVDIEDNRLSLREFRGKVLLIVNVASKCGFTRQYASLERLYRNYKERGLVVLGFPSNDFFGQEPGTDEEILRFCSHNYGVSFPIFSKIKLSGRKIHPLFSYLISKQTNPGYSGRITWNFNKFLVNHEGLVVGRFGSRTDPDSDELIGAVENAIAEMGV